MFEQYLQDQNFLALAVATLAYWAIGSLWFGPVFGKAWMAELEKNQIKISRPDSKAFAGMMISSFIYNLLTCFALSYLVFNTGSILLPAALKIGALLGVCVSFASLGVTYLWVSRTWKLLLIDGSYHIAGVMAATLILSQWR